jgi:HK97 family phage major capsid protein
MNETVQSEGGFLVQPDFASALIQNVFETGKLASRVNRFPLGAGKNSLKINGIDESSRVGGSRWGGIQMYWLDEAGEKTKSKPKFRQIELSLKKLIGLCYATDELLEDATSLGAVITQAFQNEMGFMVDSAIFSGTGSGQPLGILNAASTVSQGKETNQTANTVVYENVVKMWSRLLPDSQANAIWMINQNVFPQLAMMGLAVGTGGSAAYMPPTGAAAAPYATLMGRPIVPLEQSETLGTAGDIMVGDFGKGYIFIDKGVMKQDLSIHVRFKYDEQVFRFVYRCDGQPALAKAITPLKGGAANALGHFVKLALRN